MAALLRFEQQGEGGIASDLDPVVGSICTAILRLMAASFPYEQRGVDVGRVERGGNMPWHAAGGYQHCIEADVGERRIGWAASQISAAAAIRCLCRGVTLPRQYRDRSRAFTSTKMSV